MKFVPFPGTFDGPCSDNCDHESCAEKRAAVCAECIHCREPIGYRTVFVQTSYGAAHAACDEVAEYSEHDIGVCRECGGTDFVEYSIAPIKRTLRFNVFGDPMMVDVTVEPDEFSVTRPRCVACNTFFLPRKRNDENKTETAQSASEGRSYGN